MVDRGTVIGAPVHGQGMAFGVVPGVGCLEDGGVDAGVVVVALGFHVGFGGAAGYRRLVGRQPCL